MENSTNLTGFNSCRQWWHKHGFKLVPCKTLTGTDADKTPLISWLPIAKAERQTEVEAARLFPLGESRNTAAIILNDVVVLDCENKAAAAKVAKVFPELTGGLVITTGKGAHYYARKPPGWNITPGVFHSAGWNSEEIKPEEKQVEIRVSSEEGAHYCIVPPSRHPQGIFYEFASENEPPEVPDFENRLIALVETENWLWSPDKKKPAGKRAEIAPELQGFYDAVRTGVSIKRVAADQRWYDNDARGKCPIHNDTPSHPLPCAYYSHADSREDRFRCWSSGCGVSGDQIQLYALKNNVKYHEAALRLAKENHVKHPFLEQHDDKTARLAKMTKSSNNPVKMTSTPEPEEPELALKTDHLPCFAKMREALGLVHDGEYTIAEKAAYYSLVGLAQELKQPVDGSGLRSVPIFRLGKIQTDARVHLNFMMPQGTGKQNLHNLFNKTTAALDGQMFSSARIPHPKQLVGKVLRVKKKKVEDADPEAQFNFYPLPGGFGNDLVLFDEAGKLFTETKETADSDSRAHYRVATNPFGSNLIQDKDIETPNSHKLSYYSPSTIITFCQPQAIPKIVVTEGTFRRACTIYNPFPGDQAAQLDSRVDAEEDPFDTAHKALVTFLKEMVPRQDAKLTPSAIKLFKDCIIELKGQAARKSPQIFVWCEWNFHTYANRLLTLIYNLAAARKVNEIDNFIVLKAYADFFEICQSEWSFAEWAFKDALGGSRINLNDNHKKIVLFLLDAGAEGKDGTAVFKQEMLDYAEKTLGFKPDGAEKAFRLLKKQGILSSDALRPARVWLTPSHPTVHEVKRAFENPSGCPSCPSVSRNPNIYVLGVNSEITKSNNNKDIKDTIPPLLAPITAINAIIAPPEKAGTPKDTKDNQTPVVVETRFLDGGWETKVGGHLAPPEGGFKRKPERAVKPSSLPAGESKSGKALVPAEETPWEDDVNGGDWDKDDPSDAWDAEPTEGEHNA